MRGYPFIVLLLLFPGTFASAGGGQEAPPDEPEQPQRLEVAQPNPVDDISDYEIRFMSNWDGTPTPATQAGEEDSALWAAVEDRYDVRLRWIREPTMQIVPKLTASVLAGDPVADVFFIGTNEAIPNLADANLILPIEDYFDVSDPRWPEFMHEQVTYAGHYWGVSSQSWTTHGIWYNVSLFQRLGLPDLYELQESGEWTWEAYLDIARTATQDTDGDGETDVWGIGMAYDLTPPLVWSNGGSIVEKSDGGFEFALDRPNALEALDFTTQLWQENLVTRNGHELFKTGQAAMYGGEAFQGGEFMNSMSDLYGFVYYPRGPRATEYSVVSATQAMPVFPSNLRYPPERLAQVFVDLQPWDKTEERRIAFLEDMMIRAQDIQTALGMMDRVTLNRMNAFPGLRRSFYRIVDAVREGTSAATAVEQHRPEAENAIRGGTDR